MGAPGIVLMLNQGSGDWIISSICHCQLRIISNKSLLPLCLPFRISQMRGWAQGVQASLPVLTCRSLLVFEAVLSAASLDHLKLLLGWNLEEIQAPEMDKCSPKLLETLNSFTVKKYTEVTYFLKETAWVFTEAVAAYYPEANQTFWHSLTKCHDSTEKHLSPGSWNSSWNCLFVEIMQSPELGGMLGSMRDFNIHLAEVNEEVHNLGAAGDVSLDVIKY